MRKFSRNNCLINVFSESRFIYEILLQVYAGRVIELPTAAEGRGLCDSSAVAPSIIVIERSAFVEISLWPVAEAGCHAVDLAEAGGELPNSTIVPKPITISELAAAIDQQPVECIVPVVPGVFLNTRKLQLIRLGSESQTESVKSTQSVKLTAAECQLIKCLAEAREARPTSCSVSEQELLKTVCGYSQQADSHTVKTHVARLRQKLGVGFVARDGGGYRLGG